MLRRSLQIAIAFTVVALPLRADQNDDSPAALSQMVVVDGITIAPIPNAPFSATTVIEFQRPLDDGSVLVRRTISLIARDSKGRIHNERRRLMPESFHGSPSLLEIRLFDPETRITTTCIPSTHIARRITLPQKPEGSSFPNPFIHVEDLGSTTLNGLKAKGTRRSYIVSARASGTGRPVKIEDEDWYSEDLHINLLVHHTDPRIGEQTIGISALKREDPPASMFEVPKGYTIVNADPAPAPTAPAIPAPAASATVKP